MNTKKYFKKTIYTLILFIAIFVVIAALVYVPLVQNKDDLIFSKTYKVSDVSQCKINTENKYCLPTNRKYKIIPNSKNWQNPLNPVFSLIMNENISETNIYYNVLVVSLKRDNWFDLTYSIESFGYNSTFNLSYNELEAMVTDGNIYTDSPNSSKIKNIEPLSESELQKNRDFEKDKLESANRLKEYFALPLTKRIESLEKSSTELNEQLELVKKGVTEYKGYPMLTTDPEFIQDKINADTKGMSIMKKILSNQELTLEEKIFADEREYFNNVQ